MNGYYFLHKCTTLEMLKINFIEMKPRHFNIGHAMIVNQN